MNQWERLSSTHLEEKEEKKFQRLFVQTVKKLQTEGLKWGAGEHERKGYFLVVEENRAGGWFVHIVPAQLRTLFEEMNQKSPNAFLGFSVLAGEHEGKPLRASCFGVKCDLLAKSLANSTKRCWSYRWSKSKAAPHYRR